MASRFIAGLVLVTMLLSGCVAKRFNVENLSGFGSPVSVEYKDSQTLYEEDVRRAQVMLRSPPESPGTYSIVLVNISSSTIGGANTKYWGVRVASLDGTQVFGERSGGNDIPNYTYGRGASTTTWWNIMTIILYKPMPDEFKVHVFDRLMTRRYDFIVRRNLNYKS